MGRYTGSISKPTLGSEYGRAIGLGNIRTRGGAFYEIKDAALGKRMYIIAPGLAFGNRWIHTAPVTDIREENAVEDEDEA